ncbi:MAG: chromosomal replication initiator protein DnaA [Dehalococcoidia bacterium]
MEQPSAQQLWETALGELQLQVTRPNYETWLRDTVGVRYDGETLIVGAPTDFATAWLGSKLRPLIAKTLSGIAGAPLPVTFEVLGAPAAVAAPRQTTYSSSVAVAEPLAPATTTVLPLPRLIDKYVFGTFIVGNSNQFAHAAAHGVADRPGESYNPLFLYGGVGLGKTHLLHAIGHVAIDKGLRVLYVSSEQFTNEFVNALRAGRNEEFRSKYRSADVLLIDDIQFIVGKESTQEEFFHTFNDLHSQNRQIVITSDRSPKLISLLEDRMRSRFEWGLTADIAPPDYETRLAILRAKSEEQDGHVPEPVLQLIAHRIQDNIRELEGSLNRVIAFSRLTGQEITTELCTQAIADLAPQGKRRQQNAATVLDTVAAYFNLTPAQICGKARDKELVHARHITMYLLREEAQRPLTEVGRILGNRDHSTILHGLNKIQDSYYSNQDLRREIEEIRAQLGRV